MTTGQVKLTTRGLTKLGRANGLYALAPAMNGNTREQYIVLRVVPVKDERLRGDSLMTTEVVITAVEAFADQADRNRLADMMTAAFRNRARNEPQGEQTEIDLDKPTED